MYKPGDRAECLSANLKLYCKVNNLSHTDMAALLGVSEAAFNNWIAMKSEPDPRRQKLLEKLFQAKFDKICSHILTVRLAIDKPICIEDIFPYNFIISSLEGFDGGVNVVNTYEMDDVAELNMDYRRISPAEFYALFSTKLTDREQMVMQYRYRDGLTLEAAGEKIELTRERIRQIEHRACRKMSRVLKDLLNKQLPAREALKAENDRLRQCVYELQNATTAEDVKSIEPVVPPVLDTVLESLDFSVRTYMCLKRSQINTVKDVVNYDHGLTRIRNLGKKSLNEVVTTIESIVPAYQYSHEEDKFILVDFTKMPAYTIKNEESV